MLSRNPKHVPSIWARLATAYANADDDGDILDAEDAFDEELVWRHWAIMAVFFFDVVAWLPLALGVLV